MAEERLPYYANAFQKYPALWVEEVFGESMWGAQRKILESLANNKRTTVKSCFDIGKSFISARSVLWFLYSFPHSKVITTAPTFRQVEGILWREIRVAKEKSKIPLRGEISTTKLDISPDWFAMGLSTDEPTRFQGFHAVDIMLVIDEAAGVGEEIFQASEGIVSSENARTLYIGNPTKLEGTFYKSFRMPQYSKISISAFDTPNFTKFGITIDDVRNNTWKEKIVSELPRPYLVTPEWVYDKHERWGESSPMWQAMVMGEFPTQGDDTLIPLSKIEEASRRVIEPAEDDVEVIAADIARFGVDKTEFCHRKGGHTDQMEEHSMMDTMETAARLHDFMGFHPKASVNIDVIGVGAGVFDRLKQIDDKRSINGINVAIPSTEPEMFANLRAEMFWGLRTRFMEGTIDIPEDDDLIAQLANIKYKFVNGKIQIEGKEDMKKRGMSSPDKADALAMAYGNVRSKPAILEFMQAYST